MQYKLNHNFDFKNNESMAYNITYTDWFIAVAEIMKGIIIEISCFFY